MKWRRKKGKDGNGNGNAENDAVLAPSENIFKAPLRRDLAYNPADPSIFSEDNPFKRKPLDLENDSKKRKRPTEEESSDLGEENPKKLKTLIPNTGSEFKEGNGKGKEKIKKKRKRDEVEKDYGERKYGLVLEAEAEAEEEKVVVGVKRKKMDEEATEMMISKHGEDEEGFAAEEKLLRTVFVRNLPLKVKKKAIVKEFGRFGEIGSVTIRSIPIVDTKIPRKGAILLKKFNDTANSVHAYIVYKTKESAECALTHNMAVVGGNHIRVDRACQPRKKLKGDSSLLYEGNKLPFDVKDEENFQLFSGIKDLESSVKGVWVVRDPHIGLGKGIACVLFTTREAANLALKRRHLGIRDPELRISRTIQNSTPSKRTNPFSSDTDNSPAKNLMTDSGTASGSSRLSARDAMPYQGLRSNKADGQKQRHLKKRPVEKKSHPQPGEQQKEKRPAVAARKAKAMKEIGGSKQAAGKKRKLDGRTPDSLNQKLKTKKFRPGN